MREAIHKECVTICTTASASSVLLWKAGARMGEGGERERQAIVERGVGSRPWKQGQGVRQERCSSVSHTRREFVHTVCGTHTKPLTSHYASHLMQEASHPTQAASHLGKVRRVGGRSGHSRICGESDLIVDNNVDGPASGVVRQVGQLAETGGRGK